jgi:prepilin-type N-terminal cleavage/methylation domain-containing protein
MVQREFMRNQKGFSLIELLLVVAVILIIAAIAVPNFLRSRMAANEASAVASLHNIESAQTAYTSTYPSAGFAPDLNTLGPGSANNTTASSTNALLLDIVLGCPAGVGTASCQKSGYNFYITTSGPAPIGSYTVNANPTTFGTTGQRYFYSDLSGVIRYNATAIAALGDQPIQ